MNHEHDIQTTGDTMISKEPFHVNFYIDGFTLKKVNDYYRNHHPLHAAVDFIALRNWARQQAIRLFDPPKKYAIMECHYYHPYKDPKRSGAQRQGMMNFERELRHAGFQIHYLQEVGDAGNKPNMDMISDATRFACYREVDAVILLTTQGQFSPLPGRLKGMGIPTLLLGWNFCYEKESRLVHWKTDSLLKSRSDYYIAMEQVANKNLPRYSPNVNLFKTKNRRPQPPVFHQDIFCNKVTACSAA